MMFSYSLNEQNSKYSFERNIETLFCNHCCSGKAVSFAYYGCVSVALSIPNAVRFRHIVICVLSGCTVLFLHYLINGKIFEKGF